MRQERNIDAGSVDQLTPGQLVQFKQDLEAWRAELAARLDRAGALRDALTPLLRGSTTIDAAHEQYARDRASWVEARAALLQGLSGRLSVMESALEASRHARANATAARGYRNAVWAAQVELSRRVLGSCVTRVPLLMLPVRLETRFDTPPGSDRPTALKIRVYPDDIHLDGHDPALTADEKAWAARYRTWFADAANSEGKKHAAWQALAARLGARRAAWVLQATEPHAPPAAERPANWARATTAALMPARWLALAYRGSSVVAAAVGRPIPAGLAVGPSPLNGVTDTKWLSDFDAAIDNGMALSLPLPQGSGLDEGIDRLLVVGIRAASSLSQGASELAALLQSHRHTGGLSLVPRDTPTNNTATSAAGSTAGQPTNAAYTATDRVLDLELGPAKLDGSVPMPAEAQRRDGHWLAWALGVPHAVFARAEHADGQSTSAVSQAIALAARDADSPLLRRLGLGAGQALEGAPPAFGQWPAWRVGEVPYALLPAKAPTRALKQTRSEQSWHARLAVLNDELRRRGATASAFVQGSRIGGLLAHVGQANTEQGVGFRGKAVEALDPTDAQAWWRRDEAAGVALDAVALRPEWWVQAQAARRVATLRKRDPHGLRIGAWGYVEGLRPHRAGDGSARSHGYFQAPSLAHAATLAVLASGSTPDSDDLAGIDLRSERVHRARWLLEGVRQGQSLATLLGYRFERRLQDSADRRLPSHIARLRTLAAIKRDDRFTETLKAVNEARAALDAERALQQSRNDAERMKAAAQETSDDLEQSWKSALAGPEQRYADATKVALASMETAQQARIAKAASDQERPERGASVIEDAAGRPRSVRVDDDRVEYHLWHALNDDLTRRLAAAEATERRDAQAETVAKDALAAVHKQKEADPELAAAREALARTKRVFDDLPEADVQTKSNALDAATSHLRGLVASSWDDAMASSAVNRTVDGLELYRRWRLAMQDVPERWDASTVPAGDVVLGFPPLGSDEWTALRSQLDILAEEVDAVADLSVAEGLHQLMRGNPARGSAALDVLNPAAATPPPTEHEVVRTPRSGTVLTHRALVVLPVSAATPAWPDAAGCARARAEPALEAWAATVLPAPERIVCIGTVSVANGAPQPVRLTASALGLSACTFMHWAAASPVLAEGRGEGELVQLLDERLRATLSDLPEGAVLCWEPAQAAGLAAGDMTLADAAELACSWHALAAAARPMDARDVGSPQAAIDMDEAIARVGALTELTFNMSDRLRLARAALNGQPDASALASAASTLRALLPWRIPAALPLPAILGNAEELRRRLDAALGELEQRQKKAALPSADQWDSLRETVRALLGGDAQLLPVWRADAAPAAAWEASMRTDSGLVPGDQAKRLAATAAWTMQLAYVRDGMARLQRHIATLQTLQRPGSAIAPGQVPWAAGERWVAMPRASHAAWPRGRTSLLTLHPLSPVPPDGAWPYKGLLVDDWTETLPTGQDTSAWQAGTTWQAELGDAGAIVETTGLVMHVDRPNTCAPHVALLAVSQHGKAWDIARLQRTVIAAVDLARSRAAPHDGGVEQLWFTDELPLGAQQMSWYPIEAGTPWHWAGSRPRPLQGRRTHRTPAQTGYAQHWFSGADTSQRMTVEAGDRLVVYVYLPTPRPRVLVVQWGRASPSGPEDWEHRAVWCAPNDLADQGWWAQHFAWGEFGKASRHWAGSLPQAGAWVRLEVSAASVGLEGQRVSGMSFGTADGEAVWGPAGLHRASLAVHAWADAIEHHPWFGSRPPEGAVCFADDPGPEWAWSVQPALQDTAGGAPWPSHVGLPRSGMHQHGCKGVPQGMLVQRGDRLFVDVCPRVDAAPSAVIVQWMIRKPDGSEDWNHRAVWCSNLLFDNADWWSLHFPGCARGTASLQRIGNLPSLGVWTRLQADAQDVGLPDLLVRGIAFTLIDGGAAWGANGVSRPALAGALLLPDVD